MTELMTVAEATAKSAAASEKIDLLVYSKSDCPFCTRLSTMLDRMGESYVEVKLDDAADRKKLYDREGLVEAYERTMPQVFLDGKRVGGYSDFVTRVNQGPLR